MKIHRNQAHVAWLASILALCLVISVPLRAQVSGATLSGAVTDAQGGAVPGAKVSVRNLGTGIAVETTTNAAGAYTVPNLIPADYDVGVSAPGFNTAVAKVTLAVGAKVELNIPLKVGEITQSIEVTGAALQVELSSSTLSGEVVGTQVRELPLNGRDWASLATLEPGVVEARTHREITQAGGGGGRGLGDQLSIGGGRPTQNSYRLDGAIVNDYTNAGPGSVLGANLGVDAIQEFTVLTSNYSAEYGFTSGGVINAVTRSGTNQFHGSAFDFLRNDKLDAANFFSNANGLSKNALKQNQFGASGGWRIFKDRTFLFGDYEGVRRVAGLPVSGNVTISDAVRSGNVVNLSDPACPTVTVARIDSTIQKFLGLYPHPVAGLLGVVPLSATSPCKNLAGTGANPNIGLANFLGTQRATENFYTFRGDQKISSKDNIFVTYLRDSSVFTSPLTFNNELQSFTSYRQAVIVEETHAFSSSFVNTVRLALDRTNNFGGHTPTAVNPLAGDLSLGMNTPGLTDGFFSPGITLTGSGVTNLPGGVGGGVSVQNYWGQIFQVYDDAFANHGTHGLKFGFEFLPLQVNAYNPLANYNGSGTFSFVGTFPAVGASPRTPTSAEAGCLIPRKSASDGNNYDNSCGSLVDFLTNQPLSAARPFESAAINKHYLRAKVFGGHVQDDWRFRPSLTLNLGLRFEMATNPTEIHGEVLIMPTQSTPLPCGPAIAGSCPLPGNPASVPGDPNSVLRPSFFAHNPTLKNFEPRIGFAWDPFHNGKTAVRGGFGIFDALPLPYELILNNTSADPFGRSTLVALGPSPGLVASPSPGTWPYSVPGLANVHVINPLGRRWNYVDANIKRNYVYQYNLNVQRQITPSTTVLVGYTGSRGLHNPFQVDSSNTVLPTVVPGVGDVWPIPWSGSLTAAQQANRLLNTTTMNIMYSTLWQSRSWYNAMLVKVDKRLSHGFQVQGSFTWSKSMDDSSGSTAGDTFSTDFTTQPWYDLSLNKGLSDFNVGRNLVINGLWNAPTPKSLGAFGDKVLGGWQLGLIMTVGDGVPVTPGITGDLLGEVIMTVNPPNLVAGCSAQNLVNPNYRHSLFYANSSCLSLVPLSAANASVCDSTRAGVGFPGFCPNIRGNLGRNTIVGPGLTNANFSVFKNNYVRRISETFNVQFRAEFFNVLNHTNFAPSANGSPFNPNGLANPLYGQITSTQTHNREIQIALKVVW